MQRCGLADAGSEEQKGVVADEVVVGLGRVGRWRALNFVRGSLALVGAVVAGWAACR